MLQLSRLEDDMRKLPSSTHGAGASLPDKRASPEQPSTRHTSISATSTAQGLSSSGFSPVHDGSSATSTPEQLANPPLGAFNKKKKKALKKRRLPAKDLKGPSQSSAQRYWNEFDDGSEGERDEPYTIFVDPKSSGILSGAAVVSKFLTSLSTSSKAPWEKIKNTLTSQPEEAAGPDERSPLMDSSHSPISPTIEDSSDSDNETTAAVKRRSYSTIASQHRHPARSARESMLFRCSLGSFAASFIFVIVAAILVGTGRRKAAAKLNIGVAVCVGASAVSVILGVGCTVSRRDILHWFHRSAVGLTLLLVILANAGVVVGLSHARLLD